MNVKYFEVFFQAPGFRLTLYYTIYISQSVKYLNESHNNVPLRQKWKYREKIFVAPTYLLQEF